MSRNQAVVCAASPKLSFFFKTSVAQVKTAASKTNKSVSGESFSSLHIREHHKS